MVAILHMELFVQGKCDHVTSQNLNGLTCIYLTPSSVVSVQGKQIEVKNHQLYNSMYHTYINVTAYLHTYVHNHNKNAV